MSTPASQGPDRTTSGKTTPNDPDAIKAEIEATREQLGRTVDELSHRLDVPERAKEGAFRARDTAVETYRESPPAVIGAGAGVVALLGLLVWRRRTKDRRVAKRAAKREAKRAAKVAAARRAATAKAARKAARKRTKQAGKKAAKARRAVRRTKGPAAREPSSSTDRSACSAVSWPV